MLPKKIYFFLLFSVATAPGGQSKSRVDPRPLIALTKSLVITGEAMCMGARATLDLLCNAEQDLELDLQEMSKKVENAKNAMDIDAWKNHCSVNCDTKACAQARDKILKAASTISCIEPSVKKSQELKEVRDTLALLKKKIQDYEKRQSRLQLDEKDKKAEEQTDKKLKPQISDKK